MMRLLLKPVHLLTELSGVYALGQWVGRPTTRRFRKLFRRHVPLAPHDRVLDLGCGIGGYRDCFVGDYHGIDINPQYVETCRARHRGRFDVMDCTDLRFADASFDHVVTIATTHHLSDEELVRTVREALRVCAPGGMLHVIDAILPVSPNFTFKRLYFRADRGRHPRELGTLLDVVGRGGEVAEVWTKTGPLHDTCYLRVVAAPPQAAE